MDARGSDSLPIRDVLTDALRYWELRRIAYNLVLALVVLASIALAWPQSRSLIRLITLLPLFVLAVIANICYSAAYMVDVPVQLSGFRSAWQKWRWTLWAIGTAFAATLAFFWIGNEAIEP